MSTHEYVHKEATGILVAYLNLVTDACLGVASQFMVRFDSPVGFVHLSYELTSKLKKVNQETNN